MYNFSHTKAVLSNKTSQELRVLSRSLSDCHSLTLNVMILSVSLSLSEGSTIALKCSEDAKFKMSVTELLTDNVTYWGVLGGQLKIKNTTRVWMHILGSITLTQSQHLEIETFTHKWIVKTETTGWLGEPSNMICGQVGIVSQHTFVDMVACHGIRVIITISTLGGLRSLMTNDEH